MMSRFEVGRIAGIPIFLDMMFVLILLLFSFPYFTAGDPQLFSAGIVIVIGVMLSILLHELGHAFAGRLFNAHVSHIELTGIGGIAHFARSLPPQVLPRTVIFLAGPAVNLALWYGLSFAGVWSSESGKSMLAVALFQLAITNKYLMIFNLMPAYPLDGGQTLDAWLGKPLGSLRAVKVVGTLGLGVAALVALASLPTNFFGLLVAYFLFQTNWEALQSAGGWGGGRR
jgi:Zn-dependent protease